VWGEDVGYGCEPVVYPSHPQPEIHLNFCSDSEKNEKKIIIFQRNVSSTKCSGDEIFCRRNVLSRKCYVEKKLSTKCCVDERHSILR